MAGRRLRLVGRAHPDDRDAVVDPLECRPLRRPEREPAHLAGQVHETLRREDLARAGRRAEPGRLVQCPTTEPVAEGDGFAGVEADADAEGEQRVAVGLRRERRLELDRRPQSATGRLEGGECLVPAELDELAAPRFNAVAGDLGEAGRQTRRRLVAVLGREPRVAADVRDEERPNPCRARPGIAHQTCHPTLDAGGPPHGHARADDLRHSTGRVQRVDQPVPPPAPRSKLAAGRPSGLAAAAEVGRAVDAGRVVTTTRSRRIGHHPPVSLGPYQRQLDQVVALVAAILGPDLVGAYLHGSTATGRLRPRSDLDLLVVSRRATTRHDKERLVRGLFERSNPADTPGPVRPVELTIVVEADLRPWRYPPRFDFLYGEWLRRDFAGGNLEPRETTNPDLAALITMVLKANSAVVGPPPAEVLDPVPPADLRRAVVEGIDGLLADLAADTRNVVLTFARIWLTVATGEIGSKDAAADWALARLPQEHRAVLARARAIYLGDEDEHWDDLAPRVRPYVDHVLAEIGRLAPGDRA